MWLLFISFVAFSSLPLLSFHCASPATRRHMGACESLVYVHICANTEDGRFKKKNQLPSHSLALSHKRRISPVGFSKWIPGFLVFPQAQGS